MLLFGIVICILGIIFGFVLACYVLALRLIGTIRIVKSDEDGPYLFLELDQSPERFSDCKYVLARIRTTDERTQK